MKLLTLLGLLLVFLEYFLPGGIFALLGIAAFLTSLRLCYLTHTTIYFLIYCAVIVVATLITCAIALYCVRRSKKRGEFCLSSDQEGFVAATLNKNLIGKIGIVSTELKPAGHISIEGEEIQVLSETGFLSKGTPVLITGERGAYFLVKIHQ